jgi:hypothetical protein
MRMTAKLGLSGTDTDDAPFFPAVDLGSRSAVTVPEFCELRFMMPPENSVN